MLSLAEATVRRLLRACGWLGVSGAVAVLLGDVIGAAVKPSHNPLSDTISALAIGRYSWIQDVGLNLLALGMAACGLGQLLWKPRRRRWWVGFGLWIAMALLIFGISEHDEYLPSGDPTDNWHKYLVTALYLFFAATALFNTASLHSLGKRYMWTGYALGLVWLLGGPLFWFAAPDAWDGLVERLVGGTLLAWVGLQSKALLRVGRDGPQPGDSATGTKPGAA
ncbi:MAG: DUF998 domain-containing protein [Opitutales bacterium]